MIYAVVIEGDDDHVKIGKTKGDLDNARALKARLSGLQTSSPRLVKCIALAPGYSDEEKRLHRQFAECRVRREWFLRTTEVNAWIERNAIAPVSSECDIRRGVRRPRSRAAIRRVPIVEFKDGTPEFARHQEWLRFRAERKERLSKQALCLPLTDRQSAVLRFIAEHIAEHARTPTMRTIGEALGIRSTNGVSDHLIALRRKGALTDLNLPLIRMVA